MTAPPAALADRAIAEARHRRATDPDGLSTRDDDWPQWARVATIADLGDYLDPDNDTRFDNLPAEHHGDPCTTPTARNATNHNTCHATAREVPTTTKADFYDGTGRHARPKQQGVARPSPRRP